MHIPAGKPGYRALRKGRWSEVGRIYLVTTTTWHRMPCFSDGSLAAPVAEILSAAFNHQAQAQLLCWVLMPDHWHGLVQLTSPVSLSACVGLAKGRSAHAVRGIKQANQPLWAPGFHDRALRREEELLPAARYLIANPLRAGLVRRIADYPYWDAVWLSGGRSGRG